MGRSGARRTTVGPSRVASADPTGFADAWGRRPLLASAAELPGPFDDLLDLDGVDELLSRRGLRTPFLRMAKDGAVVDRARFTRPAASAPRSATR